MNIKYFTLYTHMHNALLITMKRLNTLNEWFSTFEKYFWPMKQNQFRLKTQEKGLSISCKVLRCFKSLQNRFEIFQLMVDANLEPILNTITNTYLDINRFKYFFKVIQFEFKQISKIYCTSWFKTIWPSDC